ncbi:hypothetical protein FJ417_04390 [Mesorhizobium sp. B3-1-7]|uniref:hypothetical protein n=1 Tax=Mesorhizobium sp. B3-1-7 TaxID=2589894 RepID=UPI00112BA200|nr:hypothetical protein [Mesorhizobium sp. B3-1-7]TPI63537.1 hypothetical protein FJ417_04390 [Mesorhizobium sp. B3-1-7]
MAGMPGDGDDVSTRTHITLLIHPGIVQVLASMVRMLADGLSEISIGTDIIHDLPADFDGRAIVLGANLYQTSALDRLPGNSIIFNVENYTSNWITDDYCNLLRRFHVWDFSESNAIFLSRKIGRPVHYFRMFYVDGLARIGDAEQDIDVLFYGSFNERRSAIIDEMRARGLRVEALFNVFAGQLDQFIARSKVIINIHFYGSGQLEIIRVFDLLANGRAVVSEINPGELVDADLTDAFVAASYENLVAAAEALVHDTDRRHKVATAGFEAFSRRRATNILPEALAWSDLPNLPGDVVLGRGKIRDPRVLNIDISNRWHPDIVADISDPGLFEREFMSERFGPVRMDRGLFASITASHVLEHVADLVTAMTNCLTLLADGGLFNIVVPYDLSYGAWQDPTHVHAFNERSWLYYCEWYWYLGWTESRFELVEQTFGYSSIGDALAARGVLEDEILRSPRAVDEMRVVLRKRQLTEAERDYGRQMRGDSRA